MKSVQCSRFSESVPLVYASTPSNQTSNPLQSNKTAVGKAVFLLVALLYFAFPQFSNSQAQNMAKDLTVARTEEGQAVVMDAYTWQRRELSKKLPLDQAWPDESHIQIAFKKYGLSDVATPAEIPVPAKIIGNIYLVGSRDNLTYLIDCGKDGLAIIDPGAESNFGLIITNIKRLGLSESNIRWVLNTHSHFDHSGADYLFRKLGAKILIGEDDAAAVEKGTRETAAEYVLGPTAVFTPSVVDWRLSDGEQLHLGNTVIEVIHTPGHTAGSSCFFLKVEGKFVLFGGDTVLYDSRLGDQGMNYVDNSEYIKSLKKLARFHVERNNLVHWDILLPGHGALVMDRANMDVLKAWHTAEFDLQNCEVISALPFGTSDYRSLMYGRP